MFEIFFGTANPHAVALDEDGKQVKLINKIESDLHKDAVTERCDTHAKDLEVTTECTLKEFMEGCTKRIMVSRNKTLGDGKTVSFETIQKEIDIKPGMRPGHKMRFVGEGHCNPNDKTGDLIVTVGQIDHPSIRRVGDNLIYRHKICLSDALSATAVEFNTLEGEIIKFRPDDIITPEFQKVFEGKGMPIYNDNPLSPLMMDHDRGDFILKFQIEFPKSLSDTQKNRLVAVLDCDK